jgi:hypothetical protein
MDEKIANKTPFIESPLAGFLLTVPAFIAWGLVRYFEIQWRAVGAFTADALNSGSEGRSFFLPIGFFSFACLCALGGTAYMIACALRRSKPHSAFPLVCLSAGILMFASTILTVFGWYRGSMIGFCVSSAACVPPVAYAIALLAWRSVRGRFAFSWKESALPGSIAALWLVFSALFMTGRGFSRFSGSLIVAIVGFLLASLLVFCFCVARLAFYLHSGGRKTRADEATLSDAPKKKPFMLRRLPRILFSLALPIVGLTVAFIAARASRFPLEYLGFLSTPGTIALALASGIALCLPEPRSLPLRLALACLRAAFFPFSAYIMIVFLPFLPAIPFTVFFFGAGLLMALPTCNFICHFSTLRSDAAALKAGFRSWVIAIALCLSLLILPLAVASQAIWDRANLRAAIAWVQADEPELARFRADLKSVERAIGIQGDDFGRSSSVSMPFYPLLSDFSRAVVGGGRKLNARAVALLDTAFVKKPFSRLFSGGSEPGKDEKFALNAILVSSAFDPALGLMRSRIELRPRYEGDQRLGEFSLSFDLPKAAWLQNYYLYVGEEKRPGRLFEREAAVSVYESILRRKRDPGLLSVSEENAATLRVFPFSNGEERRTGFDILYAQGFALRLGKTTVDLPGIPLERSSEKPTWIMSPDELSRLKPFSRRPYLHVIADASALSLKDKGALRVRIEAALKTPLPSSRVEALPAAVSFVDFEERARSDSLGWEKTLDSLSGRGGFLPYRAMQAIALRSAKEKPYAFPVFVIVGPRSASDWARSQPERFPASLLRLFPETEGLYAMDGEGRLAILKEEGADPVEELRFQPVVRLLRGAVEAIQRTRDGALLVDPAATGAFERMLRAREETASSAARLKARYLKLQRLSKESGTLSPATSFIVLETDPEYDAVAKEEKRNLEEGEEAMMTEMGVPANALAFLLMAAAAAFALSRRQRAARRLRERP